METASLTLVKKDQSDVKWCSIPFFNAMETATLIPTSLCSGKCVDYHMKVYCLLLLTHSHSLPPTHSHSLSLTPTYTHSLPLTLTHSHLHSLTPTHFHSHFHLLTFSLTHTYSLTLIHLHSHLHSLFLFFSLSPSLPFLPGGSSLWFLRGRRGRRWYGIQA